MNSRLRSLAPEDVVLMLAFLVLPWTFSGVDSWAWRPAAGLVGVAAGIALVRGGARGLGLGRDAAWLTPAGLVVVWVLVQAVPLPPALVRTVSPAAASTWERASRNLEAEALARIPTGLWTAPAPAHPLPRLAEATTAGWPTLSLAPAETSEAAVWIAALVLTVLLTRRRASDPEVGAIYRTAWFGLIGVLALQGLVQLIVTPHRLLGLREIVAGRPFGPFVDGTHFAALVEVAVPWLIGYAAMRRRRRSRIDARAAAALGTALLALSAGIATQSRTATLLLVAGVTVTLVTVARGARERLWFLAGAIVAAAAGAVAVALSPLGARFRQMVDSGSYFDPDRLAVWKAVARMIGDFPLAGSGVGAFPYVFPRYVPSGGKEGWLNAHNDWLEWVAAAGLVGAVLLVWCLVGFGRQVVAGLRQPKRTGDREVLAGLVIGLGCVLVHGLVEFNLQIPGVVLPFAVAAGCAVARTGVAGVGEVS